MLFDGFEIRASPFIANASCKKCGNYCEEVMNGFLSRVLFCPKCENVYELKMIKVPKGKISKEFLEQARKECLKKTKK